MLDGLSLVSSQKWRMEKLVRIRRKVDVACYLYFEIKQKFKKCAFSALALQASKNFVYENLLNHN